MSVPRFARYRGWRRGMAERAVRSTVQRAACLIGRHRVKFGSRGLCIHCGRRSNP